LHTLLIASNNQGKIKEFQELLQGLPLELTWPKKEDLLTEPEETGATFAENARIKARYSAALRPGWYVVGDDSGLEVDALGGAPGVYSARYAGPDATDTQRNTLLLSNLAGVPWERRNARFVCVIALVRPDGTEAAYCGTREGYIALEARGNLGFGYDPVFYVPALGKTFGELTPAAKDGWSHRGLAAAKLVEALRQELRPTG